MAAPCSSTRSASCRSTSRSSCCAPCRRARSTPIGAKRAVKVDVRIVSATNRDLAQAVAEGRFREDLFYRLNVFPIEAPALRERREDIPALVEAFIRRFNIEEGKRVSPAPRRDHGPAPGLRLARQRPPAGERRLSGHRPGRRALPGTPRLPGHLGRSPLRRRCRDAPRTPDHPPRAGREAPAEDTPVRILDGQGHLRTLEDIERDLIQLAIEVYAGHMSEVARRLGIGRSTLYRKVREQGLEELIRGAA
jgi:DNA-binding NtrC family response regulator